MKAALLFLAMVTTGPLLFLAWLWADETLAARQDARRREEQGRQVDAEWFALLAETDTTPVDDVLACDEIERGEGWRP